VLAPRRALQPGAQRAELQLRLVQLRADPRELDDAICYRREALPVATVLDLGPGEAVLSVRSTRRRDAALTPDGRTVLQLQLTGR
jgi:hypothetical protein